MDLLPKRIGGSDGIGSYQLFGCAKVAGQRVEDLPGLNFAFRCLVCSCLYDYQGAEKQEEPHGSQYSFSGPWWRRLRFLRRSCGLLGLPATIPNHVDRRKRDQKVENFFSSVHQLHLRVQRHLNLPELRRREIATTACRRYTAT